MRKASFFALLLATVASPLLADSPAAPFAYVTTALSRTVYFKMVPSQERWGEGTGFAYRVNHDGSEQELWRCSGWYSFEVFLSADGDCLAAMGPWNIGSEPKPGDLAIAFYYQGKLLKRYSTAELVKDRKKVLTSVSHYRWLARDRRVFGEPKEDPDAELRVSWDNTFRLKTCDGIVYEFDMTTGAIKKQSM